MQQKNKNKESNYKKDHQKRQSNNVPLILTLDSINQF